MTGIGYLIIFGQSMSEGEHGKTGELIVDVNQSDKGPLINHRLPLDVYLLNGRRSSSACSYSIRTCIVCMVGGKQEQLARHMLRITSLVG